MLRNLELKFSFCKIWWSFLVCFAFLRQVYTCPKICQCDILDGQKYVQCDSVDFTVLPKEIPSDTELLYLSSTKITTLTENFFSALLNLHTIELSNNHIENIPNGVFNGLSKLVTLNLPNNGIQRVNENAFAGLSTLEKLSLSNNQLSILPQNLLRDLTSLETLNLDKNNFQSIPRGFFNNTVNLETLKLNNNNLTALDDQLLQRLSKLTNLDLSKNRISEIGDEAIQAPGKSLYSLSLNGNRLSSFPRAIYQLRVPLTYFFLFLQDNRMTTIPQEAQVIFDKIKLGKIRLSGNPYICDSSIRWLQKWLSTHKSLVADMNYIMCTTLDGDQVKLTEYNFNTTVTATTPTTTTSSQIHASSLALLDTSSFTSSTTLLVTSSYSLLSTSSLAKSASSSATSSLTMQATATTMPSPASSSNFQLSITSSTLLLASSAVSIATTSTTKAQARSTSRSLTSSHSRIDTTTVSPTEVTPAISELFPKESEIITISSNVWSTQEIPGKVNSSVMMQKEHIILATCLSAAFIALVVFIVMYCFRMKIIKRHKVSSTRYDKVRVV